MEAASTTTPKKEEGQAVLPGSTSPTKEGGKQHHQEERKGSPTQRHPQAAEESNTRHRKKGKHHHATEEKATPKEGWENSIIQNEQGEPPLYSTLFLLHCSSIRNLISEMQLHFSNMTFHFVSLQKTRGDRHHQPKGRGR